MGKDIIKDESYIIDDLFSGGWQAGLKIYDGNKREVGNGWQTINVTTRLIQLENSIVLMHNGNDSCAQVNLIKKIPDNKSLAGQAVTFLVEARVLKLSDTGMGGMIAFINSDNYNKGELLIRKNFVNREWQTVAINTILPSEEDFKGITVCLRAMLGDRAHAVIEIRKVQLFRSTYSYIRSKQMEQENETLLDTMVKPLVNSGLRREEFMNKMQSIIKGYEIANRVISDDQNIHYLIMRKHIGDVLNQLRKVILFKNYYSVDEPYHMKEQYGDAIPKKWVVNKIVIVTNQLMSGVTRLISSLDDVIVLSSDELEHIGNYSKSNMCIHANLHRDDVGMFGDKVGSQQKRTMFNLSTYHWILNLPMNIPEASEWILSSTRVGTQSIGVAKKILVEHNIDPYKTVIICPYARTSSMLSEKSWMPVIHQLKELGFFVFTNVGPAEQELLETERLQIPIDVYAALGVLGCIIIGVQSGIIDVVRMLNNDTRLMDLSVLVKPIDFKYANDRKLNQPIIRRCNTIHLLIQKEEMDSWSYRLFDQFMYLQKGNIQREKYEKKSQENNLLYAITNLNGYIREIMRMKDIVIFLSVCDTVDKYWNLFEWKLLGLRTDLSSKENLSYIAVIDKEKDIVYEKEGPDFKEVKYQSTFTDILESDSEKETFPNDNYYYMTSHGMGKGNYTKAAIVINGRQYARNKSGLNIVIFDKQQSCAIDSVYVSLGHDENMTIRRD